MDFQGLVGERGMMNIFPIVVYKEGVTRIAGARPKEP